MLDSTIYSSKQSYLQIIGGLLIFQLCQFQSSNILVFFSPKWFNLPYVKEDIFLLARYLFSFNYLSIFLIGLLLLSVLIGVLGLGTVKKK
jgi:hypothetical protein